jgi:hypothetical protein
MTVIIDETGVCTFDNTVSVNHASVKFSPHNKQTFTGIQHKKDNPSDHAEG